MYIENGTSPPVQSSPSPWTGLMDWTGMYSLPVWNPTSTADILADSRLWSDTQWHTTEAG